jgi:hypothetical protein
MSRFPLPFSSFIRFSSLLTAIDTTFLQRQVGTDHPEFTEFAPNTHCFDRST